MTPEDKLCNRVLELSASPIVPPSVSIHLGQAVARYRQESTPPPWPIGAIALFLVGVLVLAGAAWVACRASSGWQAPDCADYEAPWKGRGRCVVPKQ